jgi:hypothetical protein
MANGMYRWIARLGTLVLSVQFTSFAADRATLTGKVTDAAGNLLDHATVLVYHAGGKTGYSTFCPSCYSDCGKRAITGQTGAFRIDGLSPDLWFELLVVHDGFTPAFVKKVDPLQGPVAAVVLSQRPPSAAGASVIHGRVEDAGGAPIRDAVVTPFAIQAGHSTIYGSPAGLDPIAVSNQQGLFELSYAGDSSKMAFIIEARGMAQKFVILPTGADLQKVVVSDGALVRGRVVKSGKPVAGIEVAMVPREPWLGGGNLNIQGSVYNKIAIGTREDGTFTIPTIPAPGDWEIFATMDSSARQGAIEPQTVSVVRDDQEIDLGDLQMKNGYHLHGKVSLAGGKPVPEGARIYAECETTRDVQSLNLHSGGEYDFSGLAAGDYSLWTSIKGYQPLDGKSTLKASVQSDTDFDVVLQPAPATSTH